MSESNGLRKSPASIVVSFFTIMVLWGLLNAAPGYLIASEVTLNNISQDEWYSTYLMVTGLTLVLVFLLVTIWFAYGKNPQVLENIKEASTKYNTLFMLSVILGFIGSVAMIIVFLGEGNDIQFILIDSLLLILSSALSFWLSSFLFSPAFVEFVPYGK